MEWIEPDWPASPRIRALTTTRLGGYSLPPFDGLNLGDHVGDDPSAVLRNRALIGEVLGLPTEPLWLSQVHGCAVAEVASSVPRCEADASVALAPGRVCAVLTADCLPVLFCDRAGTRVAAAHAGWRGLAAGVLEHAVQRLRVPGDQILAWLGPAIGPDAFEVGRDVVDAFTSDDPGASEAFRPSGDRWLADIYRLARRRLAALGVGFVGGGDSCTVTDVARFFSYRRDGATGRMASLIWLRP